MIKSLISEDLLRNVRSEIQDNISFTPKETDIYRIHQSGDLANLDGLDDSSLKRLPSLLRLRDSLYSEAFRTYLIQLTKAGPLSGKKTDMAVNVYSPGCHLLCHDDVIGSRRVSYILYLTDPDNPWKEQWGGALRLYPTQTYIGEDKKSIKVPSPDAAVSIPPSFGQLSFFAVQPGESFHDVEEVYALEKGAEGDADDKRVRMAISGWYHIPQEGEHGYKPGLEEKLAEQSSLQQLQGKADQYDLPQPAVTLYKSTTREASNSEALEKHSEPSAEDQWLTEKDLEFLLKFLAPTYLTPDTLESVSDAFTDQCSLCLDNIFSSKFASQLHESITAEETHPLPPTVTEIEDKTVWKVARPPHKHRFLFQQPSKIRVGSPSLQSPLYSLLNDLLPSLPFRKWLQIATSQRIRSHNLLARRFRRGRDYTLATSYEEENPRLEVTLAITPTTGWDDDDDDGKDETAKIQDPNPTEPHASGPTENKESPSSDTLAAVPAKTHEAPSTNPPNAEPPKIQDPATTDPTEDSRPIGGYLAYIAGDEDPPTSIAGSDHGIEVPTDMSTGGRASSAMKPRPKKADPAVYQAAAEDEDDGILFSMPAGWNRMGLVLRDQGTLRFVKYVSQAAKGDRWDLVGEFEVEDVEGEEREDGTGVLEGSQRVEEGRSESTEVLEVETESSDESDD